MRASTAPTAITLSRAAGNSMVALPSFPAAATITTPFAKARSAARRTSSLEPSPPRLRLMTLTGCCPAWVKLAA